MLGKMSNGKKKEKYYDYWLCSIDGIGNRTISKLFEEYESAEAVYHATEKELEKILNVRQLAALKQLKKEWNLKEEYMQMQELGINFLTKEDVAYPGRLREIPDAPWGIFYKGTLPLEDKLAVAVIGARDCSEYGRYVAKELGAFLGRNQIQIISGMARGIDGISQEAAVHEGGITTAVLGSGVDVCYPVQNKELYKAILKNGCVLSPYPPGTQPRPQNFPPRNRIVSGLADVVVVIEARNKSGTLITVDMALEQGREVYVVPGRITDRHSDGCNRLIKQGAGVLLSPRDFLRETEELWQRQKVGCAMEQNDFEGEQREKKEGQRKLQRGVRREKKMECEQWEQNDEKMNLPKELSRIYDLLDFLPRSTEQILELLKEQESATDLLVSEVNVQLMRLCLMGLAKQETTGYFCKVGR